jgi:hypothetical protein
MRLPAGSSHAGQCRFFDEGRGPLCGIILFAQTRCCADTRFCGIGEAIGKLDPLGLASSNNVKFYVKAYAKHRFSSLS